ncbi:MAG: hypothetical protein U1A78_41200 [Polyangia bacterium]
MGQKENSIRTGDGSALDLAAPKSPDWQTCGTHRFYIHNDVLFWEITGPMVISDFVVLYDSRAQLQRQYGYALVLFDARQHGGVPPEARRYLATFKPDPPPLGSIGVFGAGLLVRTVVSLIQAAARRLGRNQTTQLAFEDDEAACWVQLARERRKLRAAHAPQG